jgi:signal transduction histidine kinase
VPDKRPSDSGSNDSVFFLQSGTDGSLKLWVGKGSGEDHLKAIQGSRVSLEHPTDLRVPGFRIPFRVAAIQIGDGTHIFLGLSERDELRVLTNLRLRFLGLWFLIVLLGFGIVFFTSRRMLSHVREITEAASRIGHTDLNARVPTTRRNDEVSQLALTLNRMLDRIESSMHQLHTITDSLAHDLRSPLTAIRGKLEMSLSTTMDGDQSEPIVSAIDELDRLTDFLNKSLDVAEAKADALRLTRSEIDLNEMLRVMIDLYEPSMTERGFEVKIRSHDKARIFADASLLHRMVANLLDNELKHLPPASILTIELSSQEDSAVLTVEDDGPGFDPEVLQHLFERRVKGRSSNGHGLGLAFIDAVARAHGGTVAASNREGGGARITITLPLATEEIVHLQPPAISHAK